MYSYPVYYTWPRSRLSVRSDWTSDRLWDIVTPFLEMMVSSPNSMEIVADRGSSRGWNNLLVVYTVSKGTRGEQGSWAPHRSRSDILWYHKSLYSNNSWSDHWRRSIKRTGFSCYSKRRRSRWQKRREFTQKTLLGRVANKRLWRRNSFGRGKNLAMHP